MSTINNDDEKSNSESNDNTLQVTICGGGNGAHAFVVTVASKFLPRFRVNWLSLYGDEALRINNKLNENNNYLQGTFVQENALISGKPNKVSKDPSEVIPNSDIIILCVPAFAHTQYLEAINEHHETCNTINSNKNLIVAAFPSACGLEFAFTKILRNHDKIVLFNCLTLPWACRIIEYGKSVEILGIKDNIGNYVHGSNELLNKLNPLKKLQSIFLDYKPNVTCDYKVNIMSSSLGSMNPVIHSAIMYNQWNQYNGELLDEKPLFYHGVDQNGAQMMSDLSDEVLAVAKKYNELGLAKDPNFRTIEFPHVKDWYIESYGKDCTDINTLYGLLKTNPGYKGLTHPMKKAGENNDKYIPNFGYRYLTEDIPFGLLVTKAMSSMLDISGNRVKTDNLDKILLWAQKVMNKKYFTVDSTTGVVGIDINSKDLEKTRVPQLFGFNNINDFLQM